MKVTENEIRPEAMFDEYLRLAVADTIAYFRHNSMFILYGNREIIHHKSEQL